MNYEPVLPEHNDNVSHEKPGREFLTLLLGLSAIAALIFWILGWAVDIGIDHLSPEAEAKIVNAIAFKMPQEASFAPRKQALVQSVLDELAPCAGLSYPVTMHLTQSTQPNAVALPGGKIIVFSGLLNHIVSRNGLAFVMAHELSHMKNRDHLRGMGRSLVLVSLSALLTGSQSDITQLLAPVSQGSMAHYSQERETAADDRALTILNCRYGHVGGALEFFEALKKDEGTPLLSHYFASHPQTQARIDRMKRAMDRLGMKAGAVMPLVE